MRIIRALQSAWMVGLVVVGPTGVSDRGAMAQDAAPPGTERQARRAEAGAMAASPRPRPKPMPRPVFIARPMGDFWTDQDRRRLFGR